MSASLQLQCDWMPSPWRASVRPEPAPEDSGQLIVVVSRLADDVDRDLDEVSLVAFAVDLHARPPVREDRHVQDRWAETGSGLPLEWLTFNVVNAALSR